MLSAEHITKRFGPFTALNDVTFTVPRGRICALLGPNGAGKSTLVKILTGLIPASEGRATLDGQPPAPRSLGVVPENLALFDDLTIEEHLYLSGPIYGLDRATTAARSDELLRILALDHARRRFLRDSSHGMRKKTALALALLHNPPVVILDEPFEGIDPVTAEAIRQLLRRIAGRGTTILLTSHILPLVTSVADELLLLRHGQLVFQGTVESLTQSLESLYFELVESPQQEELAWLQSPLS